MLSPLEIAKQLQARCRELGYAADDYLFRVTVEDVLTVLAERLAKSNTAPEQLTQPDLEQLLDQAAEYLNGEGNPWHELVSLGLEDAWPKHLQEKKESA